VIDETGISLGVISRDEALKIAKERGLDLLEVNPAANPPVARIVDYGKYQYAQAKKERRAGGHKQLELKNVQIRVKTSSHDLETKARQIQKFLQKGHQVRVHIYLRGREKAHMDLAEKKLKEFLTTLTEPHQTVDTIRKIPTGFSTTIAPN